MDEAGNFVGIAAILDYPDFALIEAIKELTSGKAGIEGSQFITAGGVAEVAIAFIPVAFVVFAAVSYTHLDVLRRFKRKRIRGQQLLFRQVARRPRRKLRL